MFIEVTVKYTDLHTELININHVVRVQKSHTGKTRLKLRKYEIVIEEPMEYIKKEIERLRK